MTIPSSRNTGDDTALLDPRSPRTKVRVRRMVCPVLGCPRQTFREQVPGLIERYQRHTRRLADQVGEIVKELAGRVGARLSRVLACTISRSTGLRLLMRQVVPPLHVPRVLGVDDFALNTLKRCARMKEPTGQKNAPRHKPTLVGPYRDRLRRRRAPVCARLPASTRASCSAAYSVQKGQRLSRNGAGSWQTASVAAQNAWSEP
ncbi:hypothetical protein Kpho02_67680 [Kitasatospora phosalacinea]|uniref:Transposase IS204/IS1001/IS1096/IS1165 DDE domain-containing protein n=1 Tax=Kitasatospora phosalacinea TaxID=2065 RepID=A0A9W6QDJ5_9ACTN|nr:hypothetical protein Kpho02_67680 [Kitasatospora phosalacinea]